MLLVAEGRMVLAADLRQEEARATCPHYDKRKKNALSVGEELKCLSQNIAGMPQQLSWEMCSRREQQ